jgi:murein L,D-transpeptidase YafK
MVPCSAHGTKFGRRADRVCCLRRPFRSDGRPNLSLDAFVMRYLVPLLSAMILCAALLAWPRMGRSMLESTGAGVADRAAAAAARVRPRLEPALSAQGLHWGAPAFLRVFKRERIVELWLQADDGRFRQFKSYPICAYSGALGPKTRQGDEQAPEGFYRVARAQLNPRSRFHLAFNLGYPNDYDRAQGYTGDFLMVHGHCVSVGCYAMGDAAIEEIYSLVDAALAAGQAAVEVQALPFRLDDGAIEAQRASPWRDFWSQLKPGYDAFERTQRPPRIAVSGGRYHVHET